MQRGHNYRSLLLAAVLFLAGATALSAQQPPGLLIEVPGGAAAEINWRPGIAPVSERARSVSICLNSAPARNVARPASHSC